MREGGTLEGDLAGPVPVQPDDAAGQRRLAGSGLADDGDAGLRGHVQVDAGQHRHRAVAGADPPDGEHRRSRRAVRGGRRPWLRPGGARLGRAQAEHGAPRDGRWLRHGGQARADRDAAAGGERAAGPAVPGRRLLPGNPGERPPAFRDRDRGEQPLRVGVQRRAEQRRGGPGLHDPAGVHDGHLGRQLADHGQIVAHVDGRHPVAPAQAADRVEDVPLGGHVEAGGGLVQHDQRGAAGEGHGQRDTLLLPARELMRVAPQQGRGRLQAHLAQHLENPGPRVSRRPGPAGRGPGALPAAGSRSAGPGSGRPTGPAARS